MLKNNPGLAQKMLVGASKLSQYSCLFAIVSRKQSRNNDKERPKKHKPGQ